MRHIGSIDDETDAQRFGDYLLASGVKNHVEEGSSGWAVWVEDDDQLDAAKVELDAFRANPRDAKYDGAVRKAEQIRKDAERTAERRQRLFHDVRTSWGGGARQWAQPVTMALILLSLLAAAGTQLGYNVSGPAMTALRFQSTHYVTEKAYEYELGLTDIRRGQVWRLITPIFIHYGPLHLIFNMFWLRDLGAMIEGQRGSLILLGLVLAAAIIPNLSEYAWSGPAFGGMSGVVYGLFGYAWIKGKYEPQLGVGVSRETVVIMMVWLFICMTGLIGPVANVAHVMGLVVGIVAAYVPIEVRKIRRSLKS
jgi:GlpG protein